MTLQQLDILKKSAYILGVTVLGFTVFWFSSGGNFFQSDIIGTSSGSQVPQGTIIGAAGTPAFNDIFNTATTGSGSTSFSNLTTTTASTSNINSTSVTTSLVQNINSNLNTNVNSVSVTNPQDGKIFGMVPLDTTFNAAPTNTNISTGSRNIDSLSTISSSVVNTVSIPRSYSQNVNTTPVTDIHSSASENSNVDQQFAELTRTTNTSDGLLASRETSTEEVSPILTSNSEASTKLSNAKTTPKSGPADGMLLVLAGVITFVVMKRKKSGLLQ